MPSIYFPVRLVMKKLRLSGPRLLATKLGIAYSCCDLLRSARSLRFGHYMCTKFMWSMFNRDYAVPLNILRIIIFLICVLYSFLAVVVVLHWGMNVCPFHFKTFKQPIPVVYGLPTADGLLKASTGEIILGGCVVQPLSGICPYCRWPARFTFTRNYEDEPAENGRAD